MKKYIFIHALNPQEARIATKDEITNPDWYKVSLKQLANFVVEYGNDFKLITRLLGRLDAIEESKSNQQSDFLFWVGANKYKPTNQISINPTNQYNLFVPANWDYNEFVKIRNQHKSNSEFFRINVNLVGKLTENGFLILNDLENI